MNEDKERPVPIYLTTSEMFRILTALRQRKSTIHESIAEGAYIDPFYMKQQLVEISEIELKIFDELFDKREENYQKVWPSP